MINLVNVIKSYILNIHALFNIVHLLGELSVGFYF